MPSAFRFLVICLAASYREADGLVSLSGIVNTLQLQADEEVALTAVVSVILTPDMAGKSLDLMFWRLGRNGEPQRVPAFAGIPLILPATAPGPQVLPLPLRTLPTLEAGLYGYYLFDRDGIFGPPEALLATYTFGITRKST